ncbi:lysostaphin resistance A-like protein [Evansella sp. AB-rgal1]|uniref:CPBP family intramembrane glutamic endopeptidase n=1 Tax=Evansella sp. AB-rgal1 TaxID=3242696 RepID=UPI00359EC261
MRFSFSDVMRTIILVLIWTTLFNIAIGLLLDTVDGFNNHPDSTILKGNIYKINFFIVAIICIRKYLLTKNNLKWNSLGFVPLSKKQIVLLLWKIPLIWILFIGVTSTFLHFLFMRDIDTSDVVGTSDFAGLTDLDVTFLVVFLEVAILSPILEEIIFRGGILQALKLKYNAHIAVWGSSLMFMLIHQWSIVILPGIFVLGLILGYLYHKYNNIYAPIGFHIFVNGFNVIAVNTLV